MIHDKIISAAEKICGNGTCFAPFPCNHKNHSDVPNKKLGSLEVCPLLRYNVKPIKRFSTTPLTQADIIVLCNQCPEAKVEFVQEGEKKKALVARRNVKRICVDCPVKCAEESSLDNTKDVLEEWFHGRMQM